MKLATCRSSAQRRFQGMRAKILYHPQKLVTPEKISPMPIKIPRPIPSIRVASKTPSALPAITSRPLPMLACRSREMDNLDLLSSDGEMLKTSKLLARNRRSSPAKPGGNHADGFMRGRKPYGAYRRRINFRVKWAARCQNQHNWGRRPSSLSNCSALA